jgi:hypothetical protein
MGVALVVLLLPGVEDWLFGAVIRGLRSSDWIRRHGSERKSKTRERFGETVGRRGVYEID